MYRDSPDELARRHGKLRARLDELRPQLAALREIEAEAHSIERLIQADVSATERRLSLPVLDNLYVASPCAQSWDEMRGDERVRFCRQCRKNVYDLSAMTREQAERLVFRYEGAVCVRFYRREDGTILTSDCPTGRRRSWLRRGLLASAVASVLTAFGLRAAEVPYKVAALPESTQQSTHPTKWPTRATRLSALTAGVLGMAVVAPEQSRYTGFEILDSPLGGMAAPQNTSARRGTRDD